MATRNALARRWTYDEFARLPEDGNRYEIIAGELHMTPAPRPIHQKVTYNLAALIGRFVEQHDLGWVLPGPVDVLFAEGNYLEPDLVFVRRDRSGIITDRGIEGAPDLVVEVVSDSTALRDRNEKRERYAWFGVPEYWVVDAEAGHVEVYRMLEDPITPRVMRETLTWRLAPGAPTLELPVAELLRGFE